MKRIKFLVTRIFLVHPSVAKRVRKLVLYDKLFFRLRDILCFLVSKRKPKEIEVFEFEYTETSQLLDTIKGSKRAMCGLRDICWLLRNDSLLSKHKDDGVLISNVSLKCKHGSQYLLGIYFDNRGYWNACLYSVTDSSIVKRNMKVKIILVI